MDHGVLNVPLSKRGNIDAEIDRWKATQARDAKAARREREVARKAAKAEAVALLDAITDERLNALAVKCNSTPAQVRDHLRSQCHWQPAFVVKLLAA
jgi:hypothetical protein